MACERFQDALMGHVYGELTPPETAAFLAHLGTCPSCTEELAGMQGLRTVMAKAEALPEPPDAILARILDAARQPAPPPPKPAPGFLEKLMRPWFMGLAVACAGAAALVLVGKQQLRTLDANTIVAQVESQDARKKDNGAPAKMPAAKQEMVGGDQAGDHGAVLEAPAAIAPPSPPAAAPSSPARADEGAAGDAQPAMEEKRRSGARHLDETVAGLVEKKSARLEAAAGGKLGMSGTGTGGGGAGLGGMGVGALAKGGEAPSAPAAEPSATRSAKDEAMAPRERAAPAESFAMKAKAAAPTTASAELDDAEEAPKAQAMAQATQRPASALPNDGAAPAAAPRPVLAYKPFAPLSLPNRPAEDAPSSADKNAPAAAPMKETQAGPGSFAGAAGNAAPPPELLGVQGMKRDMDRMQKTEAGRALSSDMKTLKRTSNVLKAQEELSAAAEMLSAGQLPDALAAFQRAERMDTGGELAPNPKAGQVIAQARMNHCEDALELARSLAKTHPRFSRRPGLLAEVATCLDRRNDAGGARAVREEQANVERNLAAPVSGGDPAARAEAAQAVKQAVLRDSGALAGCEIAATRKGELPKAVGVWTVALSVRQDGRVTSVEAKGPAAAPLLAQCLENVARTALIPALAVPGVSVMVEIPIQPRTGSGGNAPK